MTTLQDLLARAKASKAAATQEAAAAPQEAAAAPQEAAAPVAAPAAPKTEEEREVTIRELAPLVTTDEEAVNALALLMAPGEEMSLAAIAASVDTGGGMSHSLPFATIKNDNWDVNQKYTPDEVYRFMPAGNRPFYAVYVAHRIGATGWIGAGSAGKGGNPPAWRFALPSPLVDPKAVDLVRETLKIGRKVQFTTSSDRVKFDDVGRLTPEIQILVWTPDCGFVVLVGAGHKTVDASLTNAAKVEKKPGTPVKFGISVEETVNKRVQKADPNAKNAAWTDAVITVDVEAGSEGERLFAAWNELKTRDVKTLATHVGHFKRATDYSGLTVEEVETLLSSYSELGLI